MEVVGDLENGSREPECNGLKTVEDEYMETIKWTAIPVFGFKAQSLRHVPSKNIMQKITKASFYMEFENM